MNFNRKALKLLLSIAMLSTMAIACTDDSDDITVVPPAKEESKINQESDVTQPNSIEGTVWKLISLTRQPILAESEITAEFTEGRVNGTAGCNLYFADYQLDNAQLDIETIGSTKKACPNDLMEQETTYLNFLDRAESATIVGNVMTINTPDGDLVFEAAVNSAANN